MKTYIKYLKYLLRHKRNVFKICVKRGMYLHAITHDLSKFRPKEFIPYARKFYGAYPTRCIQANLIWSKYKGYYKEEVEADFLLAWEEHFLKNKHHEEHWIVGGIPRQIPEKHIDEMIVDWMAMGIEFGDTAQEYYIRAYKEKDFNKVTRLLIEKKLGLNFEDSSFVLSDIVRLTKSKSKLKELDTFIEEKTGVKNFSNTVR